MCLSMTTAAKRRQRGQSLVEFAFMVPLILGMLVFLRQVNMAINSSIVNQRYARATLHFLTFNHRWYPEQKFVQRNSHGTFMRRWWVGVEEQKAPDDEDSSAPIAPTITIGRLPGSDTAGVPAPDDVGHGKVRIRTTSFICLAPFGNKLEKPYSQGGMPNDGFLDGGNSFRYCED